MRYFCLWNPAFALALHAASLHCWENLRLDATETPVFHALCAFEFGTIHSVFKVFVSCPYLQDVAFDDIESHFSSLRPIWYLSQVLLEAYPIVVGDYRDTDFRIIGKLGNKVIKSNVAIIYVNYKQCWSKNRTLWDSTCDWSPIWGSAIDDYPLFSIA